MKVLVSALLLLSLQPTHAMTFEDIEKVYCQAHLDSILNDISKVTLKSAQLIRDQVATQNKPRGVADVRILIRDLELTYAYSLVSKGNLLRFAPQLLSKLRALEELAEESRVAHAGIYSFKERLLAVVQQDANVRALSFSPTADQMDNLGVSRLERAMLARERIVTQNLAWLKNRDQGYATISRFVDSLERTEDTLAFLVPPQ